MQDFALCGTVLNALFTRTAIELLNCRLFLPGIGGSFCMSVFHHGILCKCPPRVEAFTKRVTENGVNNNEFI